jgi:hypothetical protein
VGCDIVEGDTLSVGNSLLLQQAEMACRDKMG